MMDLGCRSPCDVDAGPSNIDPQVVWWRVAVPISDLGQWWSGAHRIRMPGWGSDDEFIRGTGVAPATVLFALVTAFT